MTARPASDQRGAGAFFMDLGGSAHLIRDACGDARAASGKDMIVR